MTSSVDVLVACVCGGGELLQVCESSPSSVDVVGAHAVPEDHGGAHHAAALKMRTAHHYYHHHNLLTSHCCT